MFGTRGAHIGAVCNIGGDREMDFGGGGDPTAAIATPDMDRKNLRPCSHFLLFLFADCPADHLNFLRNVVVVFYYILLLFGQSSHVLLRPYVSQRHFGLLTINERGDIQSKHTDGRL
jgi:hypothetical protein